MTKRKKDITGYEYDELMSTLRVSVSKHFLDESFSLVWANDYYYELIRYTKEEYEEKFYNNYPDEIDKIVKYELNRLIEKYKRREDPFNEETIKKYYDLYKKLK